MRKNFESLFLKTISFSICFFSSATFALTLGVTEGVTYKSNDIEIASRFEDIAKALSVATKQSVDVRVISKYNDLREALKSGNIDIAFVHPAHIAFDAIKEGKYKSVAWTNGFTEYKVSLLCKEPSQPIKNWSAVAGKSVVMPDSDSITSVVARAMLKEHALKTSDIELKTTRYQDAISFYVDNGFSVYGATASNSVIKAWKDKGGKVCAESRPVPVKQWLVRSALSSSVTSIIRETILGMEAKTMGSSGYSGFVAPVHERESVLIKWLD